MRKLTTILLLALAVMLAGLGARAADEIEAFSVSGDVEFAKKGSTTWMPLAKGVLVAPGYTIRTGANSSAVLRWFEGNAVKIGPSSLFSIDSLSRKGAAESSKLDLVQGSIYAKSKKISAGESAFEVKTPTAIAGVRGTEFFAEIAEAGKSTFAVTDGQITVEAQSITVILDTNYMISVEPGMPPGEIFSISDDLKGRIQADAGEVKQAATAPPAPVKKEEEKKEEKKTEEKKEEKKAEDKKEEIKEEAKEEKKEEKKEPAKETAPAVKTAAPQTGETPGADQSVIDAIDLGIQTLTDTVLDEVLINVIIDDIVTPAATCCSQ